MIEFTVHGDAAPQGSKGKFGQEDNPRTRPWRAAVAAEAARAMQGRDLFTGPVQLEAFFHYSRPAAHFGSGRNRSVLRSNAPDYKQSAPDVDKLLRAILDALQGTVLRNDSQVVICYGVKLWDSRSFARVVVREVAAVREQAA